MIIETYFTGSPYYLSISFNEVFTDLVFSQTRHLFTSSYTRYLNPDTVNPVGELYRDSNGSWYMEGAGTFTIHGFLRPYRSVQSGPSGTSNHNLGVLFHGSSWFHRRDTTSNTSAITGLSHTTFNKYVYATPLINRASTPTGTFNAINYISVNTSNYSVMQNLRIRTRKHSSISRT